MLAPRSYTREDVVELQCHGSEVCLNRVLRACLDARARLADPGCSPLHRFKYIMCVLLITFELLISSTETMFEALSICKIGFVEIEYILWLKYNQLSDY